MSSVATSSSQQTNALPKALKKEANRRRKRNGASINTSERSMNNANDIVSSETELTDIEIKPLINELQAARLKRISWRITCILCMSIAILLFVVAMIAIGITVLSYTVISPYHNHFITKYLVDDNHLVESGSAVSIELTSAGSYLRQGLGFSWVYQRLHDVETKTPPTQLHMFVFQQQQQPLLASSSSSLLSSGLPESSISSSSSSGQSVLSSSSPTNNRLIVVYGSEDSKHIRTTLLTDRGSKFNTTFFPIPTQPIVLSISSMVDSTSTVAIDAQGGQLFATLYSVKHANTYSLSVVLGHATVNDTVYFDDEPFEIFKIELPHRVQQGPTLGQMQSLPNNQLMVMAHREDLQFCTVYLLQFNASSQWTINQQVNLTGTNCRSGNIALLSGSLLLVATESHVLLLHFHGSYLQLSSDEQVSFSCRPSYTQGNRDRVNQIESYVDVKPTGTGGFVLTCTWYNSGYSLFGVIRKQRSIELGTFAIFSNDVVADTVRLVATSDEMFPTTATSLFISYKAKSSSKYFSLRAASLETYQGFYVAFSKPFRHFTFEEYTSREQEIATGRNFSTAVAVCGMGKSKLIFASTQPPEPTLSNAILEFELGQWHGGITWVGVAYNGNSGGGSVSTVQKGISTNHRGLIPGGSYYADETGKLTLSRTDTYVGVARSSSELMLADSFVN